MKKIEITYTSKMNELAKLNTKLERAEKSYAKKMAAAQKAGVAEWTDEFRRNWLTTIPTDNGWIINKEDIKKNGAWLDMIMAEHEVEDIKDSIQRAETRIEKIEKELDAYHAEIEKIEDLKEKERLFQIEFEQEQAEWKKDGIDLQGRYYGRTPNGKRFSIERNNGWTERSFHCYTLSIEGRGVVFTSGEFWRAYMEIKKA